MKGKFTLIELLVVMTIIAILASFLFPIIGKLRLNARVTEAKTQMTLIQNAIQAYESVYFNMPWTNGNTESASASPADAVWYSDSADQRKYYDMLMELLICADSPYAYGVRNTRETRFLQPPQKFSEMGMMDYRGNRYGIAMDLDGDNMIAGTGTPFDNRTGKIFIWSFGSNRTNDWGVNRFPKDDIPSW